MNKSLASAIIAMKHKLYMQTSSHADYRNYVTQSNLVKSKVRSAQINYEEFLINKMKTNPKALYSYVKCKQKVKTTSSQESANIAAFFETTFTNEDTIIRHTYFRRNYSS